MAIDPLPERMTLACQRARDSLTAGLGQAAELSAFDDAGFCALADAERGT
ncbi:hypothetical protein [Cyanobium sp. Morenito 9A2]|nr:hypothetical protein [Cyanobium sp. Morenito 9A2]MCP9851089.1 hypothetical protein [Cyanobium sp. Morenito 9A2]